MEPGFRPRNVTPRLLESLTDSRVVVVQGARQVGKTTLVADAVAQLGGRLVTLDDALTRVAAAADPGGFVRQLPEGLLAIDEIQRVSALVLALKVQVDRDPRPGRFLVTGSADLLRLPGLQDSLAGRAESVDLHGFSQGELTGVHERFVDRLLAGDTFVGHRSDLTRADYLDRACAGSYPEALTRPPGRRRAAWYDNYVRRIVERDASDLVGLQRLSDLPMLLRMLAARNATELNLANLAAAVSIPVRTLDPYLDLLETLFLIRRVPAWSMNLSKRVVSRPKVTLQDTGLAARLVNVSATGVAVDTNPDVAGHLLEGFVSGELHRQLTWSDELARIFHYRDHGGAEIDIILETDDGRVAGLEVKASSSVSPRDTVWLSRLRDRLGERFVAGLVLHTGTTSAPFGPRITAVPMDILWTI